MSGRHSRNKGARIERECVHVLQEHGLAAERVPLSGAVHGRFGGDISVPVLGIDKRLEVKCRAGGFTEVYRWIEGNYGVVLRRDNDKPLIAIRLSDFARLVEIASRNEAEGRAA